MRERQLTRAKGGSPNHRGVLLYGGVEVVIAPLHGENLHGVLQRRERRVGYRHEVQRQPAAGPAATGQPARHELRFVASLGWPHHVCHGLQGAQRLPVGEGGW